MTESLNNTDKMDWTCSTRYKNTCIFQLGDMKGKIKRETWENNIKMELRMIGKCGMGQQRHSLAFVNRLGVFVVSGKLRAS